MAGKTKDQPAGTTTEGNGAPSLKRTKCPITREQFAKANMTGTMTIEFAGQKFVFNLAPEEFKSGSMGWKVNEKIRKCPVGDGVADFQVGLNLTVIGSKDLPR